MPFQILVGESKQIVVKKEACKTTKTLVIKVYNHNSYLLYTMFAGQSNNANKEYRTSQSDFIQYAFDLIIYLLPKGICIKTLQYLQIT